MDDLSQNPNNKKNQDLGFPQASQADDFSTMSSSAGQNPSFQTNTPLNQSSSSQGVSSNPDSAVSMPLQTVFGQSGQAGLPGSSNGGGPKSPFAFLKKS